MRICGEQTPVPRWYQVSRPTEYHCQHTHALRHGLPTPSVRLHGPGAAISRSLIHPARSRAQQSHQRPGAKGYAYHSRRLSSRRLQPLASGLLPLEELRDNVDDSTIEFSFVYLGQGWSIAIVRDNPRSYRIST